MFKYCAKCGAEVEQTSAFCFTCGTHISEENPALSEPPAAPQSQAVPESEVLPEIAPAPADAPEAPKKRKPSKRFWIPILAVAAVLVAVIVWQAIDKGYEIALKNYVAVCNGDLEKVQQLAPAEYWEHLAKTNGETAIEVVRREHENQKAQYTSMQEFYGEDARFSAKCVYTEPAEPEFLDKLRTHMEEERGISAASVKQAVWLDVYTRWDGSAREESYLQKICAVQIGSRWYVGFCYEMSKNVTFVFPTATLILGR